MWPVNPLEMGAREDCANAAIATSDVVGRFLDEYPDSMNPGGFVEFVRSEHDYSSRAIPGHVRNLTLSVAPRFERGLVGPRLAQSGVVTDT